MAPFAAVFAALLPLTAGADDQNGRVEVTPEILLAHIANNSPETPVRPEVLWLDGGRQVLVNVATSQTQAGAGSGEFGGYVPLSYVLRTIDVRTGRITDVGRGHDPGVAAEANVIGYYPEGAGQGRLVIARPGAQPVCEISSSDLMPNGTGIEAFALSADGDHIAVAVGYGAPRFAGPVVTPEGRAAVRVLESAEPEVWGHDVALWVLNGRCGGARRIGDLSETRIGRLAWADRDRQVIAAAVSQVPERILPRSDLHLFDVATGQTRILASNIGGQGAGLAPDPTGRFVAFAYDEDGLGYQLRKRFAVASLADGRIRLVSLDPRERPRWLDDLTLLADISGAHPLTRRSVALDMEGRETDLTDLPRNAVPSPDGHRLAWLTIDLYGAGTLSVADLKRDGDLWRAHDARVIWRAESPLSSYARAERRLIQCDRTDGVRPEAILVLPLGYDPRRRYPLIVDLHGGPRRALDGGSSKPYTPGTILVESTLEHDMWAAKGYAVLVADYRASGMYGFESVSRTGDAFDQDFQDIMCNVDAVVTAGVADPDRMAVVGHSYGGFEVNWIVTHTDRFKAAISKEGGFGVDQMVAWAASGAVSQQATTLYGSPIDKPETYRRMSPINFTRGVTTPTMFVSHRSGTRPGDLYGWMYAAWREQGVEAQYRIYEDPNHVLAGEADRRDQLNAALAWIDRYLAPASASERSGIETP